MRFLLLALLLMQAVTAKSQLSGTINIPSSAYPTLASALNAANASGVNGLTINISAGHVETAPVNGFTIFASGNSLLPFVIRKSGSGNNPVFIAYSGGNGTPGSSFQDGIFRLSGCDYVIVDGLDLTDNNQNNPQTMEFGFGLFKTSGNNGCQNNIIRNCNIVLNAANNGTGAGPAADGSRGIELVNALAVAHNASVAVTSVAGTHSGNLFQSNLISNCYTGISASGFQDQSPYLLADRGNTIGGLTSATTNSIINFGGAGNNAAAGIRLQNAYDMLIAGNLLNNNNGSWQNHPNTLRGINISGAASANCSIVSNTITLTSGGTSSQLIGIDNSSGSGGNNIIQVLNNKIFSCSYPNSTTGSFYGIVNSAAVSTLEIGGNIFQGNSTAASSGAVYLVYNSGQVQSEVLIKNNSTAFSFAGLNSYSGILSAVYCSGVSAGCSLKIEDNNFGNIQFSNVAGSGNINSINITANCQQVVVRRNNFSDQNISQNGNQYCINNSSSTWSLLSVSDNTVKNVFRSGNGNFYFYSGSGTSPGTAVHSFTGNLIQNVRTLNSGSGNFYGIYDIEGNTLPYPQKIVASNTITGVQFLNSGNIYGVYLSDLGTGSGLNGSELSDNAIGDFSGADNVYGIYLTTPVSTLQPVLVNKNMISDLSASNPGSSVYGSYLSSNNAGYVYSKNKISGLNANGSNGTVYGLYTTSAGPFLINNNMISDLHASQSAGLNKVNGIFINSGSLVRCFYNTVFLNTASTSTLFGCNALYSSTTPTLVLRNNILANLSVASGTAVSAAFRRSSSSLGTYSSSSNNNLFYVGQSPGNVIFHNGLAAYPTITAFQTLVSPRETASASQTLSLINRQIVSPYFLHINSSVVSAAESLCASITGFTDDADNDIRQGSAGYAGTGTAPDAGADEFENNSLLCGSVTPTISLAANTICSGSSATAFAVGLSANTGVTWQIKSGSANYSIIPVQTYSALLEVLTGTLATGQYSVQLILSCGTNSILSNEATFTVMPVPAQQAQASSSIVCQSASVLLSAFPGGTGSCLWLGPNGFINRSTATSIFNFNQNVAGTYSLYYSEGICSVPVSTVLLSLSPLTATVSSFPSVICLGGTSTLTALSNAVSYSWNGSAGTSTISVAPPSTSIYTLVVTNTANCTQSKTVAVAVINPTITANGAALCLPSNTVQLSVNAFTPSVVRWFTAPQGGSSVGTGSLLLVSTNTSTTYYANAQAYIPSILSNTMAATNTISNIMFDISNSTSCNITGLDIPLTTASQCSVEVWGRGGSASTFTSSQAGWGLLTSTVLTVNNGFAAIQFTPAANLAMTSSQTLGIYISVSGNSLASTFMPTNGIQSMANPDMQVFSGFSGSYFNVGSPGAAFPGTIKYDRGACTSSLVPVTVTVAAPPQLTLSANLNTICPGNAAVLTASGAATYSWSGFGTASQITVSPVVNTVYTVNAASLPGCSTTNTLAINIFSVVPVQVIASASLVCPYTAVTLTALSSLSYTWSNGPNGASCVVTPPGPQTYTVYSSDINGCRSAATISLNTKTQPLVLISPKTVSVCSGEPVNFLSSGALTYTWLPGSQNSPTFSMVPVKDAVVNVIGTGANSCTNVAIAQVFVDECLGLSHNAFKKFEVFPNPFTDEVKIHGPVEGSEYQVYDNNGRLLVKSFNSGNIVLQTTTWMPGIYHIVISTSGKRYSINAVKID